MVGPGLHVLARQGIHHQGHRELPRARFRPYRLFRGRHRRTARLDRAADGIQRAALAARARHSGDRRPWRTGRIARTLQFAGWHASGRVWPAASARIQEMRRLRRIKILATLGPASSDSAMIRRLFEAGADVFRINMSHTSHDKMRELVKTIRNVESSYGRPIGILVDLQGPKLRLGSFTEGSIQLHNGESFVLDSDKTPGNNTRVQLPHPEILAALKPGHALLLDDGKVRLIAEETSPERAVTRVVIGGKMSDRKGVSLPDTDLPVSAMTAKDRADLEAALVTGVDWIALSFVQRAEDVVEARKLIRGRAAVMAKIEKPQAIDRLAEIIE